MNMRRNYRADLSHASFARPDLSRGQKMGGVRSKTRPFAASNTRPEPEYREEKDVDIDE